MFGAGLAIRSGYADNLQVGHGAENALGIVDVMLTDQIFHGHQDDVGNHDGNV